MAHEESLVNITLLANADLSAKQYFAVKTANASDVTKAALAGDGEQIIGVLQNKPASGEAATIAISGVTKAKAGGVITAGGNVAVDAAGEFVAPATGDVIVGKNVGLTTADGDTFSLLLLPSGAVA